MTEVTYRNRRAVRFENPDLRVTVLVEGGHIAEILHKATGVNPLWTPPWPSIEPSHYDPARHPEYGGNAESKLLAGIMGHNVCLDVFGGPSDEEAAAGITVHGEASVLPYDIHEKNGELLCALTLPSSQLRFERRLRLDGGTLHFAESVGNLSAFDRPIAWTQHVTLGPPFIEAGKTEFRVPATRSKTFESDFTGGKGYMAINAEFEWPCVPHRDGGIVDLRAFPNYKVSGGFTTHLMDPSKQIAFFLAWSPASKLLFGYSWKRQDFPWLGIWEENHSRTVPPWNGQTVTRGMEFGASPMPETRRAMIERNSMFGEKCYRWIPAKCTVSLQYSAFARPVEAIPESI